MVTTKVRKTRVSWDEEEKAQLIKRAAELIFKHPGETHLNALRKAQNDVLLMGRRRKVVALTSIPWFRGGVDAEVQKMRLPPEREIQKEVIEEIIIQPLRLQDLSTDELIAELLKRILCSGGTGLVDRITNACVTAVKYELPSVVARLKEKTEVQAREKLKKVLVVGLLGEQQNEIRKQFGNCFELAFWTEGDPTALKQKAIHQDRIFIMKRFISHSHQELLRAAGVGYTVVPGSVSELTAVLEKYFFTINP